MDYVEGTSSGNPTIITDDNGDIISIDCSAIVDAAPGKKKSKKNPQVDQFDPCAELTDLEAGNQEGEA